MKKILIVLFLALALVSFAAAEVNVSGELYYGFTANSDAFDGAFDTVELDMNSAVDDYNSVFVALTAAGSDNALATGDNSAVIDTAEITTDWSGLLALPVGVKTTIGYDGFNVGDSLYVSLAGLENFYGYYLNTEAAIKTVVTLSDTLSVVTASNFHNAADNTVASLVGTVGPAQFTVDYTTVGEGRFGFELKAGQEISGVNVYAATSLDYNLDSDAADGSQYLYGFGVTASASGASIAASFNGDDNDAIRYFGVNAGYSVSDALSLTVSSFFDMRDAAADTYLGTDLSATYKAGAASYTLGYVATDGYGLNGYVSNLVNGVSALTDGGVYMAVDLVF